MYFLDYFYCSSFIIIVYLIYEYISFKPEWRGVRVAPQSQTVLRVKMPPIVVLPDLDVSKEVNENDGHIEMDFLMPNGIFIPFRVDFYDSVENVKLVGQCLYVTAYYMYFFCCSMKNRSECVWKRSALYGISCYGFFFSFVIVLADYCFMFIYLCCFIGSGGLIFKVAYDI